MSWRRFLAMGAAFAFAAAVTGPGLTVLSGCGGSSGSGALKFWQFYGPGGEDMIFIDGEEWPPSLHGTGTEDYFNTAWCPQQEYSAPYHGITLGGGDNWSGQISLYRFHVEDPVTFERSIRVTIEHGHANKRSDDLSSVAYWYQTEPHRSFSIPSAGERIPRSR